MDVRSENWILLRDAARASAIDIVSWEPHLLQLYCDDDGFHVACGGDAGVPDIVLHRTVSAFAGLVVPALLGWARQGVVVLNDPVSAFRARDKLATYLILRDAGVPIVPSVCFFEPDVAMLTELNVPLIVKPAHGVRGEGIRSASSVTELVRDWTDRYVGVDVVPREHFVAQHLIRGGGSDLRAYVVDGECMALVRRTSAPGEIRANLTLGGTAKALSTAHPAAELACSALAACGLDYGGVDLIEDNDGVIRILEVDAWAGFAGVSVATGADVAGAILRLARKRLKERADGIGSST